MSGGLGPGGPVKSMDDVLITAELERRPSRPPDYASENHGMLALAEELTRDPRNVLQKVASLVLELCHADSAGISVLESDNGNDVFRWQAIAGPFAQNLHTTLPSAASPSGIAVARNEVLLFSGAERAFPELQELQPRIYETLVAPWGINGRIIGTIWAIRHSAEGQFDKEDARVLKNLSHYAAAAWGLMERTPAEEQSSRLGSSPRAGGEEHRTLFTSTEQSVPSQDPPMGTPDERRWFLIKAEPERDEDGRVIQLSGSTANVYDLGLASEALRDDEEDLRTANADLVQCLESLKTAGQNLRTSRLANVNLLEHAMAARDALRESEERMRFALEAAKIFAWEYDPETRRTAFSTDTTPALGYALPEDAEAAQRLIHPDDWAAVVGQLEATVRDAGRFDAEFRLVDPNSGRVSWQSSHGVVVTRGEGKLRVVGITQNITDRKLAEEALRASEEQFRRAIEDAPIPVIMHAEDGQVLQISRKWTALTGYRPEDIPTFEAWLNRAYGPGADNLREYVRRLFRGEVRFADLEINITTRANQLRCWIFSASAPGKLLDGRRFIVGMALDITDRKAAEEALRNSEERQRLIVENAREYAILSFDRQRRITSWNPGAQSILGYTPEEAIGNSGDIIFTPEDRAAGVPEAEMLKALSEKRAPDERWHMRKDGSRFWASGVMMPMHDTAGQAIGFVKILRDQTEQLRAQEALEKSREDLWTSLQETEQARADAETATRAKDHFLAVLSHELRTPLTPVLMAVRMLRRKKELPAQTTDALEMIQRNVQLQAQMVDELLDVTRISRGKLELIPEPMDLHEVIRRAVEISTPDLEAKNQHLEVDLAATVPTFQGDPKRLQQVFWNLLKNASKFTPANGNIAIRSRDKEAAPGSAAAVIVEVSDSGIGFEAEAAERIFNPFEQANALVSQRYGGLGLGLAITKASVEAHGGSIRAESSGQGKGATFIVELPLTRPNE